MSDDGTGAGIRIPSLLIGKESGQILKDFINNASLHDLQDILIAIQFVHPEKTDNVDIEIWYSPSDDKSLRFVKNMGEFLKPIINDIKFVPNFITWPCRWCPKSF